jgi:hypothetical protein
MVVITRRLEWPTHIRASAWQTSWRNAKHERAELISFPQSETGDVDHKPGLPVNAANSGCAFARILAWSYFEATGDLPFLRETYSN